MKKTSKKILSAVLALIMLMSMTLIASAKEKKPLGYIEGIPVRARYEINVGDFFEIPEMKNADEICASTWGDSYYIAEVLYDDEGMNATEIFAKEAGVAVINIWGYEKEFDYYDEEYDEDVYYYNLIDDYFIIVVINPRNHAYDLGEVTDMYMPDITLNYKDSTYIFPEIETGEDGAFMCTFYILNGGDDCAWLYDDGYVEAFDRGTMDATCYLIDAQGHVYSSDFSVTVKYTFWQWIIKILLFGWIWY